MAEEGDQPQRRAEHEGEFIAGFFSEVTGGGADETPGPPDARVEEHPGGGDESCAGYAPIGQGIQKIIMRVNGTHLDLFGAVLAEAIIVMARANSPDGIFP